MVDYSILLDAAKEILKGKKKGMVFIDLWKEVCKNQGLRADVANHAIGDFYQLMLESNLFFFDPKTKEWGLREKIKYNEFQKISDTFLSNANDDIKEKDYKNDMSIAEMVELEHGSRNDKTSVLDLKDDNEDEIEDEEMEEIGE